MAAVDLGDFASSVAEIAPSTHVATISGDLDFYCADKLRDELAQRPRQLDDGRACVRRPGGDGRLPLRGVRGRQTDPPPS